MATTTTILGTGEIMKDYVTKVTIHNIEEGLRAKLYKIADQIVSDMMKGVRVRTSMERTVDDQNYIVTHRVTFKKGKL